MIAPGLSLTGFLNAQLFVFKQTGADESKLRNELRILGYNPHDLTYECGRNAVLSVHGTADFTLGNQIVSCDNNYTHAVELICFKYIYRIIEKRSEIYCLFINILDII